MNRSCSCLKVLDIVDSEDHINISKKVHINIRTLDIVNNDVDISSCKKFCIDKAIKSSLTAGGDSIGEDR